MFMKHYAPNRCEPTIEALNFGGGGDQGRCERRSENFVKFIFFFYFFFFFWGGGGVGSGYRGFSSILYQKLGFIINYISFGVFD